MNSLFDSIFRIRYRTYDIYDSISFCMITAYNTIMTMYDTKQIYIIGRLNIKIKLLIFMYYIRYGVLVLQYNQISEKNLHQNALYNYVFISFVQVVHLSCFTTSLISRPKSMAFLEVIIGLPVLASIDLRASPAIEPPS